MAKLKPIITTQEKLDTIDIKKGQFICVKDSNSIYIDTDTERLEYTLPRVLNYLQSGNSISIGGSNTIQGDGCVVLGNSNTASSDKAFILGQNNTVSGECAVPVIGSGNVLPENATSAVIIGCHSNSLTEIANNCINVGFLNKIIGRGYAYGEGLQTTNDFETALGAYNLSNSDIIFSIGNGTSADNRSNLLTIYKDGKVETNSFIGASITNWQANYSYKINELVIYNNILYQCNINHTSLETFEENKWNILLSAKDDSFNFSDLSTAITTGTQSGISVTADAENERFNFEVTGIPIIAIDVDGYWTINGERGDNPTKAQGEKGENGTDGTNGKDGASPTIDPITKNWIVGTVDTGVKAEAQSNYFYTGTEFPTSDLIDGDLYLSFANDTKGNVYQYQGTTLDWALQGNLYGGGAVIDDTSTTGNTVTWSASKINSVIGNINTILASVTGGIS